MSGAAARTSKFRKIKESKYVIKRKIARFINIYKTSMKNSRR